MGESVAKKVITIILLVVLVILIIAGVVFVSLYCFGDRIVIGKTKTEEFTASGDVFKVGIISDTQLPPNEKKLEENDLYIQHLRTALEELKTNGVGMILFAGDIGDAGSYFAFKIYKNTIDEVFGDDKPVIQTIMGNHDYWSESALSANAHIKAFKKVLGQSPWTHYVVNGYHFIGASPNNGSMSCGYKLISKWLARELEKASKDTPDKPIFVMTHNQPKDTCYGSEDWGDSSLNEVMSKYPNAVIFSGHSHYSILDERSIWQGDYTVLSTQSLSYTELEGGKENGSIPPNPEANPMGYILEFTNNEVKIHRMSFDGTDFGTEQKSNMLWTLPLPYKNDGRYAFESRKERNSAPIITDMTCSARNGKDSITLSFAAAADDDFVHSYKVVIDGKEEKLFFSDYYNGIGNMSKTVELTLKSDGQKHNYKIYALDSWGAQSKDCIEIDA